MTSRTLAALYKIAYEASAEDIEEAVSTTDAPTQEDKALKAAPEVKEAPVAKPTAEQHEATKAIEGLKQQGQQSAKTDPDAIYKHVGRQAYRSARIRNIINRSARGVFTK